MLNVNRFGRLGPSDFYPWIPGNVKASVSDPTTRIQFLATNGNYGEAEFTIRPPSYVSGYKWALWQWVGPDDTGAPALLETSGGLTGIADVIVPHRLPIFLQLTDVVGTTPDATSFVCEWRRVNGGQ